MVSVDVLISEMHVEILAHVQSADDSIKFVGFVEDLMCNCEVHGIEVGEDKEESDKVETVPQSRFKLCEVAHDSDKECPVYNHSCIEGTSKVDVVVDQFAPFSFCRVALVEREDLVEQREDSVENEE